MSSLRARSLKEILTFTRASTATYFDIDGVLTTAEVDEPRIEYDPVTGAVRGLLIEESRINDLLNSDTFATQSVTVTSGTYTLSFYGTGTITLSGASTAGPLVGTGADNRVSLTFTPSAGSLTLTLSGTATRAQLESGAYATSYIPTTSIAGTRAADVCTTSVLNPWFNAEAGTLFVEYLLPWTAPVSDGHSRRIVDINGGDDYESHMAAFVSDTGARGAFSYAGSVQQSGLYNLGAMTTNVVQKQAYAFSENDIAAIASGGPLETDTSAELSTALTTLRIGPAYQPNGYIRKVKFYPRRLSDNELRALVA
jgi:hypothetical protein